MIVALLVLVVLILLFGAGVVKGWIANAAGLGCGFIILIAMILWIGSFFGEDGPVYVIIGSGILLTALAFWAQPPTSTKREVTQSEVIMPKAEFHSDAPSREERKRLRELYRDGPRRD